MVVVGKIHVEVEMKLEFVIDWQASSDVDVDQVLDQVRIAGNHSGR
jgi:hypothetical protein